MDQDPQGRASKYSMLRLERQKRLALKIGRAMRWSTMLSRALRFVPMAPEWRIQFDAVRRPNLAYGMYAAAVQARALGISGITCIEFGVASGAGLRAMEGHADLIRKIPEFANFTLDIVGFDRAIGLRASSDPRDLPYWFEAGVFKIDANAVQKSLRLARYIVGDVQDTLKSFGDETPRPVGFVSFDLDHYTSTCDALKLFELASNTRLPRVLCYLDDIIGISDLTVLGASVGEEAAVADWTHLHPDTPLVKLSHLRDKRPLPQYYNEQYYCLHDFKHPLYNAPLNPLE